MWRPKGRIAPPLRLVLREHDLRVRRRLSARVDEGSGRQLLALVEGDPDLAHRDEPRRHVEQKGLVSRGARHADADGVGGEPSMAAPEGRDEGRVTGHVHEVHRDHSGRHRHLRVGADAPEMVDVAKGRHHRSELARPLDEPLHHLRADALAEAEAAVELHHRAAVPDEGETGVRAHRAVHDVVDVMRDEPDAVAVVAAEVRVHEVIGNLSGFGGLAARPFEQGADHAPHRDVLELVHGGAHSSRLRTAPAHAGRTGGRERIGRPSPMIRPRSIVNVSGSAA